MSNTRLAGALAKRCVRAYFHKQTNAGTETSRYEDTHTKEQTDDRQSEKLATKHMAKRRDTETETQRGKQQENHRERYRQRERQRARQAKRQRDRNKRIACCWRQAKHGVTRDRCLFLQRVYLW